MLILKRISLPVLLRQQKPSGSNNHQAANGIFDGTRQVFLLLCRLCMEGGGRTFEHLL
jgi:hypothetical protein